MGLLSMIYYWSTISYSLYGQVFGVVFDVVFGVVKLNYITQPIRIVRLIEAGFD